MDNRARIQPNQEKPSRAKLFVEQLQANYTDELKETSSWPLKLLFIIIGFTALVVLVLLNAWQASFNEKLTYSKKVLVIEDVRVYSEWLNYAADYNGAKIIEYSPRSQNLFQSLFKSSDNAADKALSADNSKGNCWGFEGSEGSVSIKIAKPIYPRHFTVKHLNSIEFDSAPHKFCVFKEKNERLGCYEFFLSRGRPDPEFTQVFECIENCDRPTDMYTVVISDNHGASFTCLYQFMVHGEPIKLSY